MASIADKSLHGQEQNGGIDVPARGSRDPCLADFSPCLVDFSPCFVQKNLFNDQTGLFFCPCFVVDRFF
jgi:hypothetical protein